MQRTVPRPCDFARSPARAPAQGGKPSPTLGCTPLPKEPRDRGGKRPTSFRGCCSCAALRCTGNGRFPRSRNLRTLAIAENEPFNHAFRTRSAGGRGVEVPSLSDTSPIYTGRSLLYRHLPTS